MDLSKLVEQAGQGNRSARAELIQVAYDDLRRLAQAQMRSQRPDHTLTATALVHEVSTRLLEKSSAPTESRGQFLAFAATAMRNVLVDHARAKGRQIESQQNFEPFYEYLTTYTMLCLSGDPHQARAHIRRLRQSQQLPAFRGDWYEHLADFTAGEITAEQLLTHAQSSQKNICEAEYYVGITKLSAGDRAAAQRLFRGSTAAGVFRYFEHHLSRALGGQLARQPEWPPWIPARN